MIKAFINRLVPALDFLLLPFTIFSALYFKFYRRVGTVRLKRSTSLLKKLGVFPILDHYYEPMFNDSHLYKSLSEERFLPGLDFREEEQILLLKEMVYQDDFDVFLKAEKYKKFEHAFHIENGNFESGDAEFLFNFVRHLKPKRVIEIGCGSSTKLISHALKLNSVGDTVSAEHICIEPYEQAWLETFENIEVVRKRLEDIDISMFQRLEEGDLLFIDSSHIIRPQGDVLTEYLEIIPSLCPGVFVHVHDIFSPRDYPEAWIKENIRLWNEQYLLEALLSNNDSYTTIAALNFLKHKHYDLLKFVCPYLNNEREPGSFYFVKNK